MYYLKAYRKFNGYRLFESHDHTHQICKEYGIKDYINVILDRLQEFIDYYGVGIDIDLVKKNYKVIKD